MVLRTKWAEEAVRGGTRESPQHSESLMNGIRLLNWKSTEVTSCSDALTHLKNEGVGTDLCFSNASHAKNFAKNTNS